MERIKQQKAALEEFSGKIDSEDLAQLDFDRLRQTLDDMASSLDESVRIREELEAYRQDYIARISGMEKAIAAVRRDKSGLSVALEHLASLETMSARELIDSYNRTQARFRDAFPASFGLLQHSGAGRKANDITQYK